MSSLMLFSGRNLQDWIPAMLLLFDCLQVVAALLHDVGKSRYPLRVWQKTLAVLVCAAWPGLFRRWSAGDPANLLQKPFVVNVHHPDWSADLIATAGASEASIWLVRHHADHSGPTEPKYADWLRRLQQADDAN